MKNIYLSGKIAGLDVYEAKKNFENAEDSVRKQFGYLDVYIVNPMSLPPIQTTWADYLIRDLILLKECNAIAMLPNWKQSKGAIVEHAFAIGCGMEIYYL